MRWLTFVALVLFSSSLFAQEERGPYVAVRVGQLEYGDTIRNLIEVSDTTKNLALSGGYWLNRIVAVEGIVGLSSDIDTIRSGSIGTFRADNGVYVGGAFQARVVGEVDYTEIRIVASARHFVIGLGIFNMDVSGTMAGTSEFQADGITQAPDAVFSNSIAQSANGYSLLLGAGWSIKERWSVRAEYEHFDLSRPDADVLATSVQYRF